MNYHTPAADLRRNGVTTTFAATPNGGSFECNGNVWVKVSSRTAKIIWPAGPERSFYFGMKEKVHVAA